MTVKKSRVHVEDSFSCQASLFVDLTQSFKILPTTFIVFVRLYFLEVLDGF